MAALGAQTIASSYEQLLHVDTDGGGNSTTHVSVKDGDNGTTFGFTIASDALMMTGTNRLEFGDTGTYIHQSADGVLDLVSDTEIEINATTIDVNGDSNFQGDITTQSKILIASSGQGIFGAGDGDTGIRWETNNVLAFDTQNAERLTIDANGKVGIATASPTVELDVHGSAEMVAGFGRADDANAYVSVRTDNVQNKICGYSFNRKTSTPTGVGSTDTLAYIHSNVKNATGATNAAGDLQFITNSGGSLGTRMSINKGGGISITGDFHDSSTSDPGNYQIAFGGDSTSAPRWGFRVSTSSNDEDLHLDRNLSGTSTPCMTWDKVNGNVGINQASPPAPLTINQGTNDGSILEFKSSKVDHQITSRIETNTYGYIAKARADEGGVFLAGFSESDIGITLDAVSTTDDTGKTTSANGNVLVRARKKSGSGDGQVGSNANLMVIENYDVTRFIFDAEGSGHADVEWVAFSDSRLKSNIEAIPYGLDEVLQLQPKRFDKQSGQFNKDGDVVLEDNKRKMVGFLAQDVKAIIPELVKDVDETESFYSMDDGKLVAVLVKAVQELSAKVEALENG